MRQVVMAALAALLFRALPVLAGPEGVYDVQGTGPGGANSYSGTVEVVRSGDTYAVRWVIAGQEFFGTGLGAADVKGVPTMGPASPQDTAISVGYVSEGSFGVTFYVQQQDGSWQGIRTYGGSDSIGTEVWSPR